jgi:hypothetical protein
MNKKKQCHFYPLMPRVSLSRERIPWGHLVRRKRSPEYDHQVCAMVFNSAINISIGGASLLVMLSTFPSAEGARYGS